MEHTPKKTPSAKIPAEKKPQLAREVFPRGKVKALHHPMESRPYRDQKAAMPKEMAFDSEPPAEGSYAKGATPSAKEDPTYQTDVKPSSKKQTAASHKQDRGAEYHSPLDVRRSVRECVQRCEEARIQYGMEYRFDFLEGIDTDYIDESNYV